MSLAQDNQLHEAEQFARTLFLAEPNLGIDDAARRINEECRRGLIKPTISNIRREVRQRLEAEALFSKDAASKIGNSAGYIIRKKQVFNPVRVVVNPAPLLNVKSALESLVNKEDVTVEAVESTVTSTKSLEKPAPASAELRANKADRLAFLESWALENPLATIEQAREALREKFNGVAMGTKVISDTLRMSRQIWETQRKDSFEKKPAAETNPVAPKLAEVVPATIQQQIAAMAATMKSAGISLLEITPEGRVRVEFAA